MSCATVSALAPSGVSRWSTMRPSSSAIDLNSAGHLFNEGLPQVQGDFNAMLSQMKAWKVEIEKIREANPNMSIDSIETLEKKVDADYSHEGEHDPAALNRLVQKEIIDKR